MTFFEQELQKIFRPDMGLSDIQTIHNVCSANLKNGDHIRAYFSDPRKPDYYEALVIRLYDTHHMPVNSTSLSLPALLYDKDSGRLPEKNDRPYILAQNHDTACWQNHMPTNKTYWILSDAVTKYLSIFTETENYGTGTVQKMAAAISLLQAKIGMPDDELSALAGAINIIDDIRSVPPDTARIISLFAGGSGGQT